MLNLERKRTGHITKEIILEFLSSCDVLIEYVSSIHSNALKYIIGLMKALQLPYVH